MGARGMARRDGDSGAMGAAICPREVLLALDSRFRLEPGELDLLARAAREASPAEWEGGIEETLFRWTAGVLCHPRRGGGVEPPAKLQKEYRRIALEAVQDEAELRRLGPALRAGGVAVLLIKGAALKGLVYGNPGLRPADDSDWVVRTSGEWEAARHVLADHGYRGGEGGAVWARPRPAPQGEPFRVPAPEDHLLILCAHLMKHNLEPGIWFTDLEALLRSEAGLDWGAVLSRARARGVLRPPAPGLPAPGAPGGGGVGGA